MTAASALFNLSVPAPAPAAASRAGGPGAGNDTFGKEMARQRAAQQEAAAAAPAPRPRPEAQPDKADDNAAAGPDGGTDGAGEPAEAGLPQRQPHDASADAGLQNAATLAQQALALAVMSAELQYAPTPGSAAASAAGATSQAAAGTALESGLDAMRAMRAAAATLVPDNGGIAGAQAGTGAFASSLAASGPGPAGAHTAAGAGFGAPPQAVLAPAQGAQVLATALAPLAPASPDPAAARRATPNLDVAAPGQPATSTAPAALQPPALALDANGAGLQPQPRHAAEAASALATGLPADPAPAEAPGFSAPQSAVTAFATASQPAGLRDSALAAPAAQIATPVSHAQWGQDLGRHLVNLTRDLQQATHTAELRLDPPELGPLRVTITLSDGVAQASFVSSHAAVRQALEAALPQLHQALAQAGISLGQTNVGDQGPPAQFANAQQNDGRQGDQSSRGGSGQGEGGRESTAAAATPGSRRAPNALVDTFA